MYGITHPDAECARPVDVGRDSRRRRDFALRCIVHGRGGCSPSVWYASRHRCRSVGQVVLSSDLSLGRILMTVIIAAGRGDASFVVALGIFAAEAERVRFCRFCGSAEQKCRLCRLKKAHAPRVVRGRSSCYAHHICAALRLRHQDVLQEPGWLNVGDEAGLHACAARRGVERQSVRDAKPRVAAFFPRKLPGTRGAIECSTVWGGIF